MLVDTHAHLGLPQFDRDVGEVIGRAAEVDVSHIVTSRRAVELAESNTGLSATVGFHPHVASSLNKEGLDELRELTVSKTVVAVGEIGLDYYRDLSPRYVQGEAFRRQLEMAIECRLPVVIHDRNAHDDIAGILEEYADQLCGAVLHCYSGGIELALTYLDLGFYFSVSGQITYPKADALRETIASIPMERLLLETDAPYLTPQPVRGRRNEPQFMTHTARCLAELKRISYDDVCRITSSNAERLLAVGLNAQEMAKDGVRQGLN
jgi:TatD DNase family protein